MPKMLVRDMKKRLDDLGMEYIEEWVPAWNPIWKEVEVFFNEEQMEDRGEDEATSMVCTGGWPDARERLQEMGIL